MPGIGSKSTRIRREITKKNEKVEPAGKAEKTKKIQNSDGPQSDQKKKEKPPTKPLGTARLKRNIERPL